MADQIVNTPGVMRDSGDSASALGWVIALIVVLAIIVAAFVWYRNAGPLVPNTGDTNINVELPTTPGGGTGGGAGGGMTY